MVTDCIFDHSEAALHCFDVKKKKAFDIRSTESGGYVCRSNPDFQLKRQYELDLQKRAATCDKNLPERPKVTDCTIDAKAGVAYCAFPGEMVRVASYLEIDGYACRSNLDENLRLQYQIDMVDWILSGCH